VRIYRANSTEPEEISSPSDLKEVMQEGFVRVEAKRLYFSGDAVMLEMSDGSAYRMGSISNYDPDSRG
jgi:hypothetical protein